MWDQILFFLSLLACVIAGRHFLFWRRKEKPDFDYDEYYRRNVYGSFLEGKFSKKNRKKEKVHYTLESLFTGRPQVYLQPGKANDLFAPSFLFRFSQFRPFLPPLYLFCPAKLQRIVITQFISSCMH